MKFPGIIMLALMLTGTPALAQVNPGTTPLTVPKGGTGSATAAGARTNLGLGSMAVQNSGSVAITGGSFTGLGSPSASSDAANKGYVDSVVGAGLGVQPATTLVATVPLPNSPTYANGASGVGATLTAGSNSTLTVDSVVAALNAVVLVNGQASAFQNGIYTVTTAGSGGAPWVLTRATYFDQPAEMLIQSYTVVLSGVAYTGSSWALSATTTTVGTTPVNFNQFSLAVPIDVSLNRGYLSGLVLSTAGSSTTFGISVGVAVDATSTDYMKLTSAFTKTTGAWVVGTGNGGLDTGTIAAGTWYHVFVMKRPDTGVVGVCISVTVTACTTGGNIPAAYTLFRRIGSIRTDGSSQWRAFTQNGDEFLWATALGDVAVSNLNTTATLYTLTVPTGVKVNALVRGTMSNPTVGAIILINSPDETAVAANSPVGNLTANAQVSSIGSPFGALNVRTNTSSQVRAVSTVASTTLRIATHGWIDTRGRFN